MGVTVAQGSSGSLLGVPAQAVGVGHNHSVGVGRGVFEGRAVRNGVMLGRGEAVAVEVGNWLAVAVALGGAVREGVGLGRKVRVGVAAGWAAQAASNAPRPRNRLRSSKRWRRTADCGTAPPGWRA